MQAVSMECEWRKVHVDSLASKMNFDMCLCEGISSRFARTIWLFWHFLTIACDGISFLILAIGPQ